MVLDCSLMLDKQKQGHTNKIKQALFCWYRSQVLDVSCELVHHIYQNVSFITKTH